MRALLLSSVVFAAACQSSFAAGPEAEALFSCAKDDECEVADLGRCDACNGGWDLGVRRGKAARARELFGEPAGGECTERGCSRAAVCLQGRCAVQQGTKPRENFTRMGPQRCAADGDCAIATPCACECCVNDPTAVTKATAAAMAGLCKGRVCPPDKTCDKDCTNPRPQDFKAVCQASRCVKVPAR